MKQYDFRTTKFWILWHTSLRWVRPSMVCYNQSRVTIWLRNDFLFDCYITYHVHTYMKSLSILYEPNLISNGERNHFINVLSGFSWKPIILLYSEPFSSLSTRVKYTILCTFKLSLLPFILRNHSCIIFPSFLSSHKTTLSRLWTFVWLGFNYFVCHTLSPSL